MTKEKTVRAARPWIVKLGGSLAKSGRLSPWLSLIERARRPVVLVPGGGDFADTVRLLQPKIGFSDVAAHRMAILAMHQTAWAMADLCSRVTPVETFSAIQQCLSRGEIPVWLPLRSCERDRRLPIGWTVTSDAIAARLAERIRARGVVLAKSCDVRSGMSVEGLVFLRIVDPVFGNIVTRAGLDWRLFGPTGQAKFASLIGATPDRDDRADARPSKAPARDVSAHGKA